MIPGSVLNLLTEGKENPDYNTDITKIYLNMLNDYDADKRNTGFKSISELANKGRFQNYEGFLISVLQSK